MSTYKIKSSTKSKAGTSFHGHTIKATYNELVDLLGKPGSGDGGYKVNFDWIGEVARHDGAYSVFTVYDWKERYRPKGNQSIDWHIGAKDEFTADMALKALKDAING